MMIKGKIYTNSKGLMLNITGDITQIKIPHKTVMIIEVSDNGRELKMKPWDDVKL